jgi:hypothetical protein
MKRLTRTAVLAGLVIAALGAASTTLTVKEVMGRLNKGSAALTPTLRKQIQAGAPDWSEIQKETKEYVELATALSQAQPPKGNGPSWAKFTREYADAARALNVAADQQNKSAALAAHRKLTNLCMSCHQAHRQ